MTDPSSIPEPLPPQRPTVPAVSPVDKWQTIKKFAPFFLAAGGIVFGATVYALIQRITTKPAAPTITTVIVSPTPSPTPFRYPTEVSTSSAFLLLQQEISSFSATLREFSKEDPSLTPPNLVLPIGL